MKDFLAVLEVTIVIERLLVTSACILKSGVNQDTTPPSDSAPPCSVIPVDFLLEVP